MNYIQMLKRLKNCNSILCECMADSLEKNYIPSEEVIKCINLCKLMSIRNKKNYGEDVSIIPDENLYQYIEFYTGISEDKLLINNKKIIDEFKYFSRFNYRELGEIIDFAKIGVPEQYKTKIIDICNYLRICLEANGLRQNDEDYEIYDSSYLYNAVKIYTNNAK